MSIPAGIWHSFRREFLVPYRTPRLARTRTPRRAPLPLPARLRALARHWRGLVTRRAWLHCDVPGTGALVPPTLRGVVEVRGWALAADGHVLAVTVACDGQPLGAAALGRRRPDVARDFSHLPAARRSGFVFRLDTRPFTPGAHTLTLTARTDRDRGLRLAVPFLVDNDLSAYGRWRQQTAPNAAALGWMRRHAPRLPSRPLVSVLVAVRSAADAAALAATAESVRDQAYPHAELVVACERAILDATERSLGPGGGACALPGLFDGEADALNRALEASSGDFFLRLDPGDELTPDALFETVYLLNRRPELDLVYADEEVGGAAGAELRPVFKPGWSPELLLGLNYLGRMWLARRGLLGAGEGYRAAFGPAADYDLVLRLAERARGVGHVPAVLCRRPALPAADPGHGRAVRAALDRRGIAAEVVAGAAAGTTRARRPDCPGTTSVILDGAAPEANRRFLDALPAGHGHELLLAAADGPSGGEAARRAAPGVRVVAAERGDNAARRLNRAAGAASGDYLLFLRADGPLTPDWDAALREHAARPEVGVVGGHLLDDSGRVRSAGLVLTDAAGLPAPAAGGPGPDAPDTPPFLGAVRDCSAVSRDCLMVRRALFHELGGFDERLDGPRVESDFCLHARDAGYAVLATPFAAFRHAGDPPADAPQEGAAEAYRARRGADHERGDRFFSPNLSPHPGGFRVDDAPRTLVFAPCPLIDPAAVRRVLAVKLDHLGDVLLALPAVRRLRGLFPRAELTLLVGPWARPAAEAEPGVDRVLTYEYFRAASARPPRRPTADGKEKIAAWLAPHRFDLAVDFRREFDTREFLRLSGARHTAGFADPGQGDWLTVAAPCEGVIPLWTPRRHMSQDALRLVDLIAGACAAPAPRRPAPVDARRAAAALLDGELPPGAALRVGIHPGSGRRIKCWPAESFGRLAGMFARRLGAAVAVFGGPGEEGLADEVVRHAGAGGRVVSLAGRLGVEGLRAALGCCDLFVGNDSGPTHLAAAAGVPTLGVYAGTVDPTQWGPLGPDAAAVQRALPCSPCYQGRPRDCAYGLECVRRLHPEQVWEAAVRLLLPRWEKLSVPPGVAPGLAVRA